MSATSLVVCVLVGGLSQPVAGPQFTLAWTHSVEKTAWEEDWQLDATGFRLIEARVQGSGAGMEPPEGAILRDGFWRYRPNLSALPRLHLAESGATAPWRICEQGRCRPLQSPQDSGSGLTLAPCSSAPKHAKTTPPRGG